MALPHKKTKIVCTIGPASKDRGTIEALIRAGMDVARLNFSHGDFAGHAEGIRTLRVAAEAMGRRIAIMADLPGPKIRIGKLASEPIELRAGSTFTLTTEPGVGDERGASVTFAALPRAVHPGDTLFLNDGFIQLRVAKTEGKRIECTVEAGGELRSGKGLNVPGVDLGIGAFTERDRECLKFALEQGVDAVSQSFVQTSADVGAVRGAAAALGGCPFVIAKIERSIALEHLDEILEAADGIMIARGDLGVEIPIERIAVVQKRLVSEANRRGKPVITATQMLESMISSRHPTRAEATDVANAILDGTDCVMLSGESAMGKYPVEAVQMLARIAATTEPQRDTGPLPEIGGDELERGNRRDIIAASVQAMVKRCRPAVVVVPTQSGATAMSVSRFRPAVWIVAVSPHESACRTLQFRYGVFPVHEPRHPDDWRAYIRRWLRDNDVEGEIALLTEGPSPMNPESNHRIEVIELGSG